MIYVLHSRESAPTFAIQIPLPPSREREGPAAQRWEGEGLLLLQAWEKKKTLTQPSPAKAGEGFEGRSRALISNQETPVFAGVTRSQ